MDLTKISETYELHMQDHIYNYIKNHVIRAAYSHPQQHHTTIYIKTMLTRLLSRKAHYDWSEIFDRVCLEFVNELRMVIDPSETYIFIEWKSS